MSSNPMPVKRSCCVSVLLPLPLDEAYTYSCEKPYQKGTVVKVPFRGRELYGVVLEEGAAPAGVKSIKPLLQAFEEFVLPAVSLKFIEWVSGYTLAPRGQILKMVLPTPEIFEAHGEPLYGLSRLPQRMTKARAQVIAHFKNSSEPIPLEELSEKANVSDAVLKGLIKEGSLTLQGERAWSAPFVMPDHAPEKPSLNLDQLMAAEDVKKSLESKEYHTFLLEGVTGSGKTEVYFDAIDAVLKDGGQSLVLLPEIALSAQWLQRFEANFGFKPAVWHSDLTPSQRKTTFRGIMDGTYPVIVGARSALFLPIPDLRLLVVDEEHDGAYKQEDGVIYNGRDMAIVRAQISNATCLLSSATPSLETEQNVRCGKYRQIMLSDRYGVAQMPEVALIDMRKQKLPANTWVSEPLQQSLRETLRRGEQAMLFLNRRGYAPLTLCHHCGYRVMCSHCSVSLVQHKVHHKLLCHHCGYIGAIPKACPECEEEESFHPIGPGVERLHEEVKGLFPEARISLMTSDHLSTHKKIHEEISKIQNHEVDILIGTQIMAKGHHFPLLTLVGIVDGDSALSGSDLRASERAFQLFHQVAGRSGREDKQGHVLIQTHLPEHPVMQALLHHDRAEFFAFESEQRMFHGFPPFGRLAALIVSGKREQEVQQVARLLASTFPLTDLAELLGPVPSPLSYLRGKYRWRLLVKTSKGLAPQALLKTWLPKVSLPPSIRVQIDIDPYSFY